VTELTDLLHRYARAIDTGELDLFDRVFIPEATMDFGPRGGVRDGIEAIRAYIREALDRYDVVQHYISNITAGEGEASCYFLAWHLKGDKPPFIVGGEYRDRLVETGEGLRIAHRTLDWRWSR
jgi:SnoaL-like domain